MARDDKRVIEREREKGKKISENDESSHKDTMCEKDVE